MIIHVVRRAQLGEVLSGRVSSSRPSVQVPHPIDLLRLEPQSVAAIWSQDPAEHPALPEALVTVDSEERDWLAWLVTYAPSVRPFTAFCRVMGVSSFVKRLEAFQRPSLSSFEKACVGLILGEVLSSEEIQARLRSPLTTSACASALSFAMVRELAIHRRSMLDNGDLPDRWSRVRKLTRQRERRLAIGEIVQVVGVLEALVRGHSTLPISFPILHACEELAQKGELSAGTRTLGSAFKMAAQDMSGTREERVTAFERAAAFAMTAAGSHEEAFALGYLASRINPGSLTHSSLLAATLQRHPSAMLWYGVCAGLSPDSGLLSELGGIGRRILRDLCLPDELVGRPRADISAVELEIALSGERPDEFPVTSQAQLSVELEPGVSTVVNWSSRARSRRPEDTADHADDRALIITELELTISRLMDLHHRVRRGDAQDREPGQQNLFGHRSEPRGTRKS